jgi:hypothetical protein
MELVLRFFIASPSTTEPDPQFEYFQRPYSRQVFSSEGYSRTRLNRFGFNDTDPLPYRPRLRALIVGDSFTEAMQVYPDQNFGSIAQSKVDGLEVCNAGRSGWGPPDFAAFVKLRAAEFTPDVLVIQVNDLDLQEFKREWEIHLTKTDDGYKLVIPPKPASRSGVHRWGAKLKHASALFTLIERRLDVLTRLERDRLEKHFSPPPVQAAENFDTGLPSDAADMLEYLHRQMSRLYPDIIYLYIPRIDYSKNGGQLYTPQHREVYRAFARRCGVTLIDPTDALLKEYRRSGQPCHGFQNSEMGKGHMNARGHRVVGKLLAEELRKHLP